MEPAKEPEPEEQRDDETESVRSEDETAASEADDEIKHPDAKGVLPDAKGVLLEEGSELDHQRNDTSCAVALPSVDDEAMPEPLQPASQDQIRGKPQDDECLPATSSVSSYPTPHRSRWSWLRRRRLDINCQTGQQQAGLRERSQGTETSSRNEALAGMGSERWSIMDSQGKVVAQDDGLPLTTRSVEETIEKLLTWMMAPAVKGIPKLGVLSAVDRAGELLASLPSRDVEDAVHEVVAGSEATMSRHVLDFCLERIPFVGCPTVLLKNIWYNLRSALVIAALYEYDVEKPRTQQEALLCLVAFGENKHERRRLLPTLARPAGIDDSCSPMVSETAQKVARMMIKQAVRRATGLQAAADCIELATLLYNNCVHESLDEDGYVCVVATPAAAARDFFRRKSLVTCALLWGSLPLLLLGMSAPGIYAAAMLAPKGVAFLRSMGSLPSWMPAVLLSMPGIAVALHAVSNAGGRRCRWLNPMRLWRRIVHGREARRLQDALPQVVTMSVFMLHAVLPAISSCSSLSMMVDSAPMVSGKASYGWDKLHGLAYMTLGLYSFCTCVTQYLKNEEQEAIANSIDISRISRLLHRIFSIALAVSSACWILVAWAYVLLTVDFLATQAERWMALTAQGQETSTLGIVGPLAGLLHAPRDVNSIWSEKAMIFCLRTISVLSQQRLTRILARREVLLRLIGAERITAHTICLLMKGVATACSQSTSTNPVEEFFKAVTPPPVCCVVVVAVRSQAIVLGCTLAIAPRIASSGILGSCGSFACGLFGGIYVAHAVLKVWYENQQDLDSHALRLALLVPGSVSFRAKELLSGAFAGARKRAVQWMAIGMFQRFLRWCFQPRAAALTL